MSRYVKAILIIGAPIINHSDKQFEEILEEIYGTWDWRDVWMHLHGESFNLNDYSSEKAYVQYRKSFTDQTPCKIGTISDAGEDQSAFVYIRSFTAEIQKLHQINPNDLQIHEGMINSIKEFAQKMNLDIGDVGLYLGAAHE